MHKLLSLFVSRVHTAQETAVAGASSKSQFLILMAESMVYRAIFIHLFLEIANQEFCVKQHWKKKTKNTASRVS